MEQTPYFVPMNDMGLLGVWSAGADEDEAFFNALPEEAQQSLLEGCTGSEQFHQRVREARLRQ